MLDRDPRARREIERHVRALIMRAFAEDGRAPSNREMAGAIALPATDVTDALDGLSHPADIVLAPGNTGVLIARPFTLPGMGYSVRCNGRRYCAPCAQDACGVGLVLGADADISARCGSCGASLRLEFRNDRIHGDAVIHSLVPPESAFENILFACATTLFFCSELHARHWCAQQQLAFGAVCSPQQALEVHRRCGGHVRLHAGFQPVVGAERLNAYASAGLDTEFWMTERVNYNAPDVAPPPRRANPAKVIATAAESPCAQLTDRERQVLGYLAAGDSQKQVAHRLLLSPYTVDTHVRNVYAKLGVRSRAAAVAVAMRERLL